jgi:hypothetical protein
LLVQSFIAEHATYRGANIIAFIEEICFVPEGKFVRQRSRTATP